MNKSIARFVMGRICLISFILFCSVFTCDNVFSHRYWEKSYMLISYIEKDNSIIFDLQIYNYHCGGFEIPGYLEFCTILSSNDSHIYTELMKANTSIENNPETTSIRLSDKRPGEQIIILNCYKPKKGTTWTDAEKVLNVEIKPTSGIYKREAVDVGVYERSYLRIKWFLPYPRNTVKFIKLFGRWTINSGQIDKINDNHTLDFDKKNTNTMKIAPSGLTSELSSLVKITGETDAIRVTGAEPGENIKIYTLSGTEVKSVVANDNVLNIKLPKNQIYIVKKSKHAIK